MNKVTFSLTLQMKRPEVAGLHEALVALGFTIAAAEENQPALCRFYTRGSDAVPKCAEPARHAGS